MKVLPEIESPDPITVRLYGGGKALTYNPVPIEDENKYTPVFKHAGKSLYRMNAKTADIYTFEWIDSRDTTRGWHGGWDWINGCVDPLEYMLNLENGRTYVRVTE